MTIPRRIANLLRAMIGRRVVSNAIRVSLVVGTCLNGINQGPTLWRGADIEWAKFVLNYVVPYLVASYSAARVTLGQED